LPIADCELRISDWPRSGRCGLTTATASTAATAPRRRISRYAEGEELLRVPVLVAEADLDDILARRKRGERKVDLLLARRRGRFDLQVVHRQSGAVQEARAKRRHRAARPIGRHTDQQVLDAIELAPGERDDVGRRPKQLKVAGGPRAEHRGRPHQRLRGRQIRDDDLASLRVEHLRVGPFDREAQLHLAGAHVERHPLRRLRRGRGRSGGSTGGTSRRDQAAPSSARGL
jgi:hypothetical protein